MRQSGGCKISAAKKQSGRHSKSRVGRRRWVRAGCYARFCLHQTLADVEVVPPTKLKAVWMPAVARSAAALQTTERTGI